ncbi:dipeptide ABC transporter ATP-binding protein [Methylobacterium oryzihabitans]|uniref:ABC transporter ATP-binding protein n=1 Tax=Methylobacterium oryzihabitans TaxID=2499852 RepID=A0A437P7Z4_9HYPH|nr:ABC transporter ATP-binding protein [Methylobacterium oryzihabitans]RVU18371.1 ABC transporter ATP-binding protein [Methylobacterium oryzihabitans]
MTDAKAPVSTAPVLAVDGLTIALPRGGDRAYAVEDVSFAIQRNEVVCLVGESGSGKSMIAHAILSLLPSGVRVAGGAVAVNGRDTARLSGPDLRAFRGGEAGMIFQEPLSSLNPLKRVGAQIAETIRTHQGGLPRDEMRARVEGLLAQVGLPTPGLLARSYPFELSGGQRQRVMIAIAMANRPALLVADEPTTALDVTTQAQILRLIDDLRRERGMGVLLITHDFGVVADVADRVVVLRGGRVVETGSAEAVLRRPRDPYTQALIDAVPRARLRPPAPRPEGAPVLSVEDLRKTFTVRRGLFQPPRRVVAADGLSLALHQGETLAVVGESGSGKSTLGRMIMRLTEPDGGAIRLGGEDLRSLQGEALRRARRGLQIVFQDPFASLDPRQKVGDAVARGPMAYGTPRREAMAAARTLLERVGLTAAAAERYPHEFSGGQRQRICIARALVLQPQVLIADEAVSALDVSVQAQVLALLAELRREMRLAMIFITHDLRIAAEIADRVIVLQKGRIVEEGATRDVFSAPREAYTRALLDAIPGRRFFEHPGFTREPVAPEVA